jgi:hypothetical protein
MVMDFFDELEDVLDELYFISESEAPAETYVWEQDEDFTVEALLKAENFEPDTTVEAGDFDDFIESQIEAYADDPDEAARFEDLRVLMADNLEEIEVFYIGEGEITVYVLGALEDGTVAGFVTELVE